MEQQKNIPSHNKSIISSLILSTGLLLGCALDAPVGARKTQQNTSVDTITQTTIATPPAIPTKPIYITIDDGPRPRSLEMAKALSDGGHVGTFFFVGEQIERHFEIAVEVAKLGHIIGNHSHDHSQYRKMTLTEAIADLEKTNDMINKVLVAANTTQETIPFRYPYGQKINKKYRKEFEIYLTTHNHNTYHRDGIDMRDWEKNNNIHSDSIAQILLHTKKDGIILMHDLRQKSIDGLQKRDSINKKNDTLRIQSLGLK